MRFATGILSLLMLLAMPILGSANFDWEQVNISSFGDSNNSEIEDLIVIDDFLFAVVENEVTGVEVWRYEEGKTWLQVNKDGFGDKNNYESENSIQFDGKLYVETNNQVTGSEIWRFDGGTSWTRVDPGAPGPGNGSFGDINNCDYELIVFDNKFYLSTENNISGTEVWQYEGGFSWTRIDPGFPGPANGGFGNAYNREANLQEFNGKLYATTLTWEPGVGVEVWRYNGGTSWELLNIEGFGDSANIGGDTIVFDNTLYVTTYNFSTGIEVWRYDNGTTWTQVNADGFGSYNNTGFTSKVANDYFLYITSKGEIWRYSGGTNWTKITPSWDTGKRADQIIFYNNNLYVSQDNESTGCGVWEYDGKNWRQINIDGFGNPNNEDIKFIIYKNYLYAYSDDEVWRWSSNKRQVNMPWIPSLLLDD